MPKKLPAPTAALAVIDETKPIDLAKIDENQMSNSWTFDADQMAKRARAMLEHCEQLKQEHAQKCVLAGVYLKAVKLALPHGEFEAFKKTFGKGRSMIAYYIALAEKFSRSAKIFLPELVASQQLSLSLEAPKGAAQSFKQKLAKFVGPLGITDLLRRHGILKQGGKRAKPASAGATADDTPPAESLSPGAQAYQQMVDSVNAARDVPLPEQCPEWFVPEGWSPRNLRRYLPGEAALTLAREGFFAAHGKLPQKRNDYSQLMPLERVVFDDVKTDWLVAYPGCKVACELWLLVAMDVATRTILDWVALAAVPDDEGKRAELLEQHMKLLGGALLTRYGIPTGYVMTWLVENQKATYREAAVRALATLSGGQIRVEYTRMVNRALPSGHTERHGTPYDVKGVLESFFGNFHNHAAALPGQTGAVQMLDAPAELAQQQKEHKALMAEVADLPAEVQEKLRVQFLRYGEAIAVLEQLFAKLNARTNHRPRRLRRARSRGDAVGARPQVHQGREPVRRWRMNSEMQRYPAKRFHPTLQGISDSRPRREPRAVPLKTALLIGALLFMTGYTAAVYTACFWLSAPSAQPSPVAPLGNSAP